MLDEIKEQIKELFERDLQLRQIMRFWIARYPLKELILIDLLDSKEGIKYCRFKLPKEDEKEC